MNPVALLLVLLSLAGLLLRPRAIALAIAVCGLAATALLAPALALPDGIPSPAASLAQDAPWLGLSNPAAGNENLRDVTYQIEPWLLYLRQELRHGALPFWNPHQGAGTPFWSNGQSAPLFPLHLLLVALPLRIGLILLPWLRLLIAGCGAWALGRALGLGQTAGLLAGVAYALCGAMTSYILYPMGNSYALLPWVLLATERLAAGTGGVAPLALVGALQLLGGHPETALYSALLSAIFLLVRGSVRPLACWTALMVAWAIAGAIAAIELLPLALTLPETSRWLAWLPPETLPLRTVTHLLQRIVLPDLYGNPGRGTWWGPFGFVATAIYVGALAPALALAGLSARRRDRRWLGIAAMALFALCVAFQIFGAQHLMDILPIVRRGLHHRIKIGLELGLALLAGSGLESWVSGRRRMLLVGLVASEAVLAVAWARTADAWATHDLIQVETAWTVWVVTLILLAAASLWLPHSWRARLAPAVVALFAIDLLAAHVATNPALSLAKLYPATPATRFLAGKPGRLAGTGGTLHPNAALVYGLYDVRQDDTIKLARFESFYAQHLGPGHPTYFTPMNRWRDPWLDRLGLRWVMTGPAESPPVAGLALVYQGSDARILERRSALPLVHWLPARPADSAAGLAVRRRTAGDWEIAWQAQAPATIEIAEIRDRGWSAEVDGHSVPLLESDGPLLAVRVGPGSGLLHLSYLPAGFGWGAGLSVAGLAALLAVWRRGPRAALGNAPP